MLETALGTESVPSAQEPQLKRFLESIFHKKNIVGSFPLGYPLVSLYAIPQFWGEELILAVCPDRLTIQKNIAVLKRQGLHFPQVAVLDGTQMPHEEREIYNKVRTGKVRLLYVLPERVTSFLFLETLIRVPIRCLVIEQAQFLLEGFSGSFRYERLWEGLSHLAQMPPLVLLTQPLPGFRIDDLCVRLNLGELERIEFLPPYSKTYVSVHACVTAHQKFLALLQLIQGSGMQQASQPWQGGSMVIHTHERQACEQLMKRLRQQNVQALYAYHPGLTDEERSEVEGLFARQAQMVVVMQGYESDFLKPPRQQWLQVVYWELPGSLEESFSHFFRFTGEETEGVAGIVLYTKEDYSERLGRLKAYEWETFSSEQQQARRKQRTALKTVRKWVLSSGCRRQSLLMYWNHLVAQESQPCGMCDTCQSHLFRGLFRRFLLRWLY